MKYFRQYRSDPRVPKLIDAPGIPFSAVLTGEKVLPGMPERLPDPDAQTAPYFFADPAIEDEYLRFYRDDPKAREELYPMLREKFGRAKRK